MMTVLGLRLRLDLVGYLDTEMPGPRDFAGVFSHPAASRFINRRSEPNAGSLGSGTHNRPAHAPTDAANDEAQRHRN